MSDHPFPGFWKWLEPPRVQFLGAVLNAILTVMHALNGMWLFAAVTGGLTAFLAWAAIRARRRVSA